MQTTAFFEVISGVSGSVVDAGNPLPYNNFPHGRAIRSAR